MDADTVQVRGKGHSKTAKDIARALASVRKLREECAKARLFEGMTKEQVLEEMRRTREEIWEETKNAVGTRR